MCYNKEKMKTCTQNAGRRELLPGAIFNINAVSTFETINTKEEI